MQALAAYITESACATLPPARPADQHRDLPEWLDYHRRLGVSHFYLMDDSSQPPLDDLLQPYIEASMYLLGGIASSCAWLCSCWQGGARGAELWFAHALHLACRRAWSLTDCSPTIHPWSWS